MILLQRESWRLHSQDRRDRRIPSSLRPHATGAEARGAGEHLRDGKPT